jgi:hypothetical protein
MPQPVTNSEIEDVLALVRRLVMEDAQPQAGARGVNDDGIAETGGVPGSPVQERLMLTPALRVVEPRGSLAGVVDSGPGRGQEPRPASGGGPDGHAAHGDDPVFRSRQGDPLRLDRRVPPADEPAFRHAPAAGPGPAAGGAAAEGDEAALRAFAGRMSVDEAALRQIVAQVIQQELRGSLGERITHNLRKLVRREILRALSENDKP